MLRLRAITYPLRPLQVTSHHSPLQPVTRTLLPAGMVVMISEYVPGPMRRLTLAATATVLTLGAGSGPAEGGYCCARPGPTMAAAAMMLSIALSALKRKGMAGLPSSTAAPLLVNNHV
jgi:hypothetical protein